jgi:hypothetical protein
MKFLAPVLAALVLLVDQSATAFSPIIASSRQHSATRLFASTEETSTSTDSLNLPTELRKITDAFANVGDDSLRHKQLLHMANLLPIIPKDKMIPENKVPGCLSTVFIDGTATWSDGKEDYVIDFVGESDGLLTKGLVALLVRYVLL